jgi:hypothetical protein
VAYFFIISAFQKGNMGENKFIQENDFLGLANAEFAQFAIKMQMKTFFFIVRMNAIFEQLIIKKLIKMDS